MAIAIVIPSIQPTPLATSAYAASVRSDPVTPTAMSATRIATGAIRTGVLKEARGHEDREGREEAGDGLAVAFTVRGNGGVLTSRPYRGRTPRGVERAAAGRPEGCAPRAATEQAAGKPGRARLRILRNRHGLRSLRRLRLRPPRPPDDAAEVDDGDLGGSPS